MTYRIIIGNWGSECVAGEIPDNIWKYIEDECEENTLKNAKKWYTPWYIVLGLLLWFLCQ